MSDKDNHNSLVVWSGGCDSTLVLQRLLRDKPKDSVRTISFNHPQIIASSRQILARGILKEKLTAMYGEFRSDEITFPDSYSVMCASMGQPALIIPAAILAKENFEDIYVGWVREDDVWHRIEHVKKVHFHMLELTESQGALWAPLEWDYKHEILKELDAIGLLGKGELVWWCDNNGLSPCGNCHSCQKHNIALEEMAKIASEKIQVESTVIPVDLAN